MPKYVVYVGVPGSPLGAVHTEVEAATEAAAAQKTIHVVRVMAASGKAKMSPEWRCDALDPELRVFEVKKIGD